MSKFTCDYDPVTIDDLSQLDYILTYLEINIFQKPELKQLYLGSRDGYAATNLLNNCEGYTDVLILVKSFDYEHLFAIYFKEEFNQ